MYASEQLLLHAFKTISDAGMNAMLNIAIVLW